MTRATLTPHPTTPCSAIDHIEVDVAMSARAMEIGYLVSGDISRLKIPPPASAIFTDELWKHTCFELFIGNAQEPSYVEFNFSPSTAWAAYRFSDYRAHMTALAELAQPRIEIFRGDHELKLTSSIAVAGLALPAEALLAITAVIELNDGTISYWALKHPAGKPDFHHRDGFVLSC